MQSKLVAVVLVPMLVGCQTTSYESYATAMASIAASQAAIAREQTQAMLILARDPSAGEVTRTVAVLMLALSNQNSKANVTVQPPQNEALQWFQVLAPTISTLALGWWGWKTNVASINANSANTIASYGTISDVAGAGFNAVGQFKPVPIDFGQLRPNVTTINTNRIDNRDGNAAIGGDANQDNSLRPINVTPPVVVVPPVVPIVPVVTGGP